MENESGLILTPKGRRTVDEVAWGVYVWELPSGEILGDGDGNYMLIQSVRNDRDKIKKLAEAARHYGFDEGRAVFWSGKRPISDEEYEHQLARAKAGLIPDPFDTGAINDEMRDLKNRERR